MKTIYLIATAAILSISSLGLAQEKKSKVCLKIDKNENGAITKIDTCFESNDPQEIEAFLTRMGATGNVNINTNGTSSKTIIINTDDTNSNGTVQNFNYSFDIEGAVDSTETNLMLVVDDKGNVITNDIKGGNIIVKKFDGTDEELNAEIKKLTKEAQANGTASAGNKKVMVFVSKQITINDVDNTNAKLPSNLSNKKGENFENLKIAPVPAKESININFSGNTKEELSINLIDEQGKTVLKEKMISSEKEINKTLNVTGVKPGIYFLQLIQGKRSEVKKVVITE